MTSCEDIDVDRFYDDMRQKIQTRRIHLKEKIDSYAEELFAKINKIQSEYNKLGLDSSAANENGDYDEMTERYQEFTLNMTTSQEFRFECDQTIPVESVFGTLLDHNSVSALLGSKKISLLNI